MIAEDGSRYVDKISLLRVALSDLAKSDNSNPEIVSKIKSRFIQKIIHDNFPHYREIVFKINLHKDEHTVIYFYHKDSEMTRFSFEIITFATDANQTAITGNSHKIVKLLRSSPLTRDLTVNTSGWMFLSEIWIILQISFPILATCSLTRDPVKEQTSSESYVYGYKFEEAPPSMFNW